jgi:folate-binding protein YgfZ
MAMIAKAVTHQEPHQDGSREPQSMTISITEAVRRARSSAMVIRADDLSVLVVRGKDRASWVNGLVTCDVAKLGVGDGAYGLAVRQKGRILADLSVLIGVDCIFLATPRSTSSVLQTEFDRYLIMEDAELTPDPDDSIVWIAHGPRARELVLKMRDAGAVAAAIDFTGLGGAIFIASKASRERIEEALTNELAVIDGAFGNEDAWDMLRIERGVAKHGVDFNEATYPQEASLEKRAVSFSKGCYLGQEVVCMLEMRGHVKQKLVPIIFDSSDVPLRDAKVVDAAGAEVGHVTSAVRSVTIDRPIALAMIKFSKANVGERLSVEGNVATVSGPIA